MPYEVILYRKNSGQVMGQFGPYARKADAQADARALATQANPDWGAMVKRVGEAIGKGAKATGRGIAKGVKHGTEYAREGAARAAETARDTAAKAKDTVVIAKLSGRVEGLQTCYEALGGRRALGGVRLEGLRAYQDAEDELRDYTEESKRGAYKRKTSRETARESRESARSARLAANPRSRKNIDRYPGEAFPKGQELLIHPYEPSPKFWPAPPAPSGWRKSPPSERSSTVYYKSGDRFPRYRISRDGNVAEAWRLGIQEKRGGPWLAFTDSHYGSPEDAIHHMWVDFGPKKGQLRAKRGTKHGGYSSGSKSNPRSRKNPPDGAPSTRRFDGRVYRYHSSVTNKKMAEAKAKRARKLDGLNARVVQIGHRHYAIYTSKRMR